MLRETLLTLKFLFAPVGDSKSQRVLQVEVTNHDLDPSFLMPFYFSSLEHKTPGDVKDLYRTFPYWGMRLHELRAEAENPTPLTSIGKMVERKQSPRMAHWRCWH